MRLEVNPVGLCDEAMTSDIGAGGSYIGGVEAEPRLSTFVVAKATAIKSDPTKKALLAIGLLSRYVRIRGQL